jgi:hypothetical protein
VYDPKERKESGSDLICEIKTVPACRRREWSIGDGDSVRFEGAERKRLRFHSNTVDHAAKLTRGDVRVEDTKMIVRKTFKKES